ncbi:hypothetical protein N1851_014128 [Merluccius polli]|uniref:Uncharacterized protein n=1 Tax=Merluccius polli TaxID=89951 RepID=A0AA47P143_MERPO|nr:hypothetical protein N1851_014128 [Merluccius polli]
MCPKGVFWEVLRKYRILGLLLHTIWSPYNRNNVVLFASSDCDLRRFAAKCDAVGMRVSTSKSKAMVLSWKKVDCRLWVGREQLAQVEGFKYLGV